MKVNNIEEAVKTMEHWVEYEKNNKDKINKADELIYIQEIILSDYKKVLKKVKRLENMYEAEKRIHIVRNEQLARKQQLVIKCNELENENKELKKENEKLKHKIEGQECVIEKQAHNEEVYEKLVMKLEKENEELKEENRKLKQKLSLHKKVLCVEQTMLKLIKEGQGSYENIAKVIYDQEVNNYNLVAIRTVISRLRKKGYNIQNVENWGYKEVTND